MKRGFTKVVWNRFKKLGIDLRAILSIEEQCAFVQDVTSRGGKVDFKAANANPNLDFEEIVSDDEIAVSGLHGKLREIQRICKNGGEAVPVSVIEVVKSFRKVAETKRDNARLMNC